MADEEAMQAYFEKYFEEHGFDPESYEYHIIHEQVSADGDPHKHTHLVAVPKDGLADKGGY